MTEQRNPIDDEAEAISLIGDAIEARLAELQRHGLPPALILGVAHATVLQIIASTYGGHTAAECMERGAERVRRLPKLADSELARMQPQGRC